MVSEIYRESTCLGRGCRCSFAFSFVEGFLLGISLRLQHHVVTPAHYAQDTANPLGHQVLFGAIPHGEIEAFEEDHEYTVAAHDEQLLWLYL